MTIDVPPWLAFLLLQSAGIWILWQMKVAIDNYRHNPSSWSDLLSIIALALTSGMFIIGAYVRLAQERTAPLIMAYAVIMMVIFFGIMIAEWQRW